MELSKSIMKLLFAWGLLAGFTYIAIGCQKNPVTPGVTPTPTTAFQQVLLANTGLAQANEDVARVVAGLDATIIDNDTKRAILTMQFQIAAVDKKLTPLLQQGPEYAALHAAEINELIGDIQTSTSDLIMHGLVGVKNPASQKQIAGSVQTIVGLARVLTTLLQQANVLKAQGGISWVAA